MDKDLIKSTDYITETLKTEKNAQIEIFEQMIYQLESVGLCRAVYHRLGLVLFGERFCQ